jgi:hypothetical protein
MGTSWLTAYLRSERREAWVRSIAHVVQPEPGEFHQRTVPDHMQDKYFEPGTMDLKAEKTVDLKRDYGHRGLQVIVKRSCSQIYVPLISVSRKGSSSIISSSETFCIPATFLEDAALTQRF